MRRGLGLFAVGLLALAVFVVAPSAARTPGAPCAVSFRASADGSFAAAGYDARPARLSRVAELTRQRFAAAALRLCAAGVLSPADLARFRHLVVQNGEGATEPVIFQDPGMAPRTFIFQFAFQNGEPPEAPAFAEALRCWKYPEKAGCYQD
jgi:hypothetical protein